MRYKFLLVVVLLAGFAGPVSGQTRIHEAASILFSHKQAPHCVTVQADEFREFHDGLCAFRVGDAWGFMDTAGAVRIPPGKYRYYIPDGSQVFPRFFRRRCAVLSEINLPGRTFRKIGFIDPAGELVIGCRYERIPEPAGGENEQPESWFFAEGFLNIVEETTGLSAYDRCVTIDTAGRTYQARPVVQACPLRSGRALLYKNGLYGYTDAWGRMAIEARYAAAADFSEGKAAVAVRDAQGALRWGIIDTAGVLLVEHKYRSQPGPFREGKSVVALSEDSLVILTAAPVCETPLAEPAARRHFDPGYSGGYLLPLPGTATRFGFDSLGKALRLPPEWRFARSQVCAGLIVVKNSLENTYGMIAPDGYWKIDPIFTRLSYFYGGPARATAVDGNTRLDGFINRSGEWVILKQQ